MRVPDVASLEEQITARTTAVILNSPGNPSGSLLSLAELARVGVLAERRDLLVVSDEVSRTHHI